MAASFTPSITSDAVALRPSSSQSAASAGSVAAARHACGNHGEAKAGQRAIERGSDACGWLQLADSRRPLRASTLKCSIPEFHKRAWRSAKVGGTTPSNTHACIRLAHNAAGCASAASPEGQQMATSDTLRGIVTRTGSAGARGRLSMTSNNNGKAVTAPYCPGKGVPSGRPTHTPTL